MNVNKNVIRAGVAAGAIGVLALAAPVIFMAAQAGAGLVALGLVGLAALAFIKTIPLWGQKLENWVLRARKNEAASNPIEQLQNFLKQKAAQVADFKSAVAMISTQIRSLEDMVKQRKRERPGYDASNQEASIVAMKQAYENLRQKYVNAEQALLELKLAIDDKTFEWKFSQAGQAALANLNATSGQEIMEQMLADTAFASVTDNFNRVFAELELEAQYLTDSKQLSYNNGMVIDVSAINLNSAQLVK